MLLADLPTYGIQAVVSTNSYLSINFKLPKPLGKRKNIWIHAPFFGTILFVVLYIVATIYYPGGSQVDKNAIGFSWTNNYWCNLLNATSINGEPNAAKPIAIAAMLVLCLTLTFFWFQFPRHFNSGKIIKHTIQISGVIAMIVVFFLFTEIEHDLVINFAALFGLTATVGILISLYKASWYGLFLFGVINLLMMGLNNYLYHNKGLIIYLPVIQKISFAMFLSWVCCINLNLYKKTVANYHPTKSRQHLT